jgi:hypothetical protein
MITILVSIVALILHFFLVCLLLRLTRQKHSLTVLLAAAGSIFCAILAAFGGIISFWHFTSYFGLEVIGVIFLYGLALKSLSLRMLTTLAKSPRATQKLADLVVRPAFMERINVLAERRMIESRDGWYVATTMGIATADQIRRWRDTLKLNSTGLYNA